METINIIHCAIGEVGVWFSGEGAENHVFIVSDRNVRAWVGRTGIKAKGILEIDAGEDTKSFGTVTDICRWLMELGADRNSILVGIGGGVTTDITGFAASVYKRGVRFAFVPTTLLSQVDAAIGGKNGVNLDSFKNMMGVIRQPDAVFVCPEPLETLPYTQIVSGAAELLKTFIIDNSNGLYEKAVETLAGVNKAGGKLEGYSKSLGLLISEAAAIKGGIAGRDPFEKGERRLLNLGHTFAHAIEKESGESVSHGNAVSMGIVLSARLAEKTGIAEKGLAARLEADFKACGMPTACPFGIERLTAAMRKDKKAEGGLVHFVLPFKVGHVETRSLSPDEVTRLLQE